MADKKVSELDAITGENTAADDLFLIVDTSGAVTKKITRAELNNAIEQDVLENISITNLTSDLSTNGNDITFGDNDKAVFGAGSDLQIYHDSNNSYITEGGDQTGDLFIRASNLKLTNASGDLFLWGRNADSVRLYHNNAQKLETTASGIDVTGNVTLDAAGNVTDGSGRPTVVLNNTSSGGWSTGTEYGSLEFHTDDATSGAGLRAKISAKTGGTNGSRGVLGFTTRDSSGTTVETMTMDDTGIDVTGTVTADGVKVGDNQNITLGADNDMTINHGGTNASINNGTGNLSYNSDQHIFGDEFGTTRQKIASNGDISFYDSTGVTQGLFWDADQQRLGLGTTSPSVDLEIASSAPRMRIKDTDTNAVFQISASSTTGGVDIQADVAGVGSNPFMAFDVGGSEAVRIDSSGNVGIGTASPTTAAGFTLGTVLEVESSSNNNDQTDNASIQINSENRNALLSLKSNAGFASYIYFGDDADPDVGEIQYNRASNFMSFYTNASEAMRIDSSGNVGIGTSSPNANRNLHLFDSTSGALRIEGTARGGYVEITDGTNTQYIGTPHSIAGSGSSTDLSFWTAGSNRMTINSTGQFFRGTTTQAAQATFYGEAGQGLNSAIGIIDELDQVATFGVTNGGDLNIKAEDGEVKVIDSASNVTTVSPHNFEMIPDGVSEDMAWAFYSRNGDTEDDFDNTKFIAVDMARVIRIVENLTGDKLIYTGTGSTDDGSTVQQDIIQGLVNRIETLEAQRADLEARLTALEGA